MSIAYGLCALIVAIHFHVVSLHTVYHFVHCQSVNAQFHSKIIRHLHSKQVQSDQWTIRVMRDWIILDILKVHCNLIHS